MLKIRFNLHIQNSYRIWRIKTMKRVIHDTSYEVYDFNPEGVLNREYYTMYIEWWIHNIGYYLTLPFRKIEYFNKLNNRFKDVDLEEWE